MRFARTFVLAMLLAGSMCASAERVESIEAARAAPGGERRIALVIGNAAYKSAPLRNPANDARAVAKALSETGFAVTLVEDAGRARMNRVIRDFGDALARGGVGLFYFAGHGMQVRNRNYLVPVDVDIEREDEVEFQAVDANLVLSKMDSARNAANILVLDACRNNPFARSFKLGATGLAQMDAPSGTLIAFATAPGQVAADGEGNNGLYTKHFLRTLQLPGLPVEQFFKQVRIGVTGETKDRQVPWESSSLKGEFFFVAPVPMSTITKTDLDRAVREATQAAEERAASERRALEERMQKTIADLLARQQAVIDAERRARNESPVPAQRVELKSVAAVPGPATAPLIASAPPAKGSSEALKPATPSPATPSPATPTPATPTPTMPETVLAPLSAPAPVQLASVASPSAVGSLSRPRVGDRWVYRGHEVNREWNKFEEVVEIDGVAPTGILETYRRDAGAARQWVYGDEIAVSALAGGAPVVSPYLATLRDLQVGDQWENVPYSGLSECSTAPRLSCRISVHVIGREKVRVAAGEFDAIVMTVTMRWYGHTPMQSTAARGGGWQAKLWYAASARRIVKYRSQRDGGVYDMLPNEEIELVSYQLK